jgi:hypothetical protein
VVEILAYRSVRGEESIRCAAPPRSVLLLCLSVLLPLSNIQLPKCHPQPERVLPSRVTRHDFPLVKWRRSGCGECGDAATQLIPVFMVNNSAVIQVACFANTNGVLFLMKLEWFSVLYSVVESDSISQCLIVNPLNRENRKTGRGISCSLNRVDFILNKLYQISVSFLMFNASGSARFGSLLGYRLIWPGEWRLW